MRMRINEAGQYGFTAGVFHFIRLIFLQYIIVRTDGNDLSIPYRHGFGQGECVIHRIDLRVVNDHIGLLPEFAGREQYHEQGTGNNECRLFVQHGN